MDWFNKKTKDLLITGTTPSLIIGGTTSPINAGNVSNKGFEFEIGWRDNIGDFNYSIKGNLATLKNKVTYLDPSLTRANGTTFHTNTITYSKKDIRFTTSVDIAAKASTQKMENRFSLIWITMAS